LRAGGFQAVVASHARHIRHAGIQVYRADGVSYGFVLLADGFDGCERLWRSIVQEKLYITGGIGATQIGEAFSYAYDLPRGRRVLWLRPARGRV